MATHSSVLAWRIPGTAEPGGLPSMGSHRVGHDWSYFSSSSSSSSGDINTRKSWLMLINQSTKANLGSEEAFPKGLQCLALGSCAFGLFLAQRNESIVQARRNYNRCPITGNQGWPRGRRPACFKVSVASYRPLVAWYRSARLEEKGSTQGPKSKAWVSMEDISKEMVLNRTVCALKSKQGQKQMLR